MNLLSPYNYSCNVSHLMVKDVFPQKLIPLTELSEQYWMDTHRCYRNRRKNSTQIYELFASFKDEDPKAVKTEIINRIIREKSVYSSVSAQHLRRLKLSLDDWIKLMSSESMFADELMIFALSGPANDIW